MNIYIIKNFTLKEVYFGICPNDCRQAVMAHKTNPYSPVSHWQWDSEEIKWGIVQEGLYEGHAQAFITALRREPQEDEWVVVYGGEDYEKDEG